MGNSGFGCSLVEPQYCDIPEQEEEYPAYGISTDGWQFKQVGWGEKVGSCGSGNSVLACPDHHDNARPIVHHCRNRRCPVCLSYWTSEIARDVENKMKKGWLAYKKLGVHLGKPNHFTFSYDQEKSIEMVKTKKGFLKLRSMFNKVAKENGLKCGCKIFHENRYDETLKRYEKEGVHFHAVGYGYLTPADEFHKTAGWIYKNITATPNKQGRKRSNLSIFGTVQYALSHCSIGYEDLNEKSSLQVLTYFGLFSNNKLKKSEWRKKIETCECEHCENVKHLYEGNYAVDLKIDDGVIDFIEWDGMKDLGIYEKTTIEYFYKVVRGSVFYSYNSKKRCKEKIVLKLSKQTVFEQMSLEKSFVC